MMLQSMFYPTFWFRFWFSMMSPPPRKRPDARQA
jgi:hypothetical protein